MTSLVRPIERGSYMRAASLLFSRSATLIPSPKCGAAQVHTNVTTTLKKHEPDFDPV